MTVLLRQTMSKSKTLTPWKYDLLRAPIAIHDTSRVNRVDNRDAFHIQG